MEFSVNFEACIGCGVCMQVCPSVFGLDEDSGKAVLLIESPASGDSDLIKEAIDSCPVGCINA